MLKSNGHHSPPQQILRASSMYDVVYVLGRFWLMGGVRVQSGCDVQQRTKAVYGQFDKTSMANIEPGSHLLWCHLIATYLISALTMRVRTWLTPQDI